MTLDFYELKEQPFAASPDPRFFFMSGTHRQTHASLLQALQAGRGFVTLLAQPGLGKTTLLLHTLSTFGDKVATVFLSQAAQTPVDVLRAILTDLGVRTSTETSDGMLSQLKQLLSEEHHLGKRVVVVLDEAQNVDRSVFDLLGVLSNLETPRGRLVQFILCGQPVLTGKLAAIPSMQATQRGGAVAQLEPFSAEETAHYLEHRLRTAGYDRQAPLFSPEAAMLIARYSQGSPRIINSLCAEALVKGYRHRRAQIGADLVREAASTLVDLTKPKRESKLAQATVIAGNPGPSDREAPAEKIPPPPMLVSTAREEAVAPPAEQLASSPEAAVAAPVSTFAEQPQSVAEVAVVPAQDQPAVTPPEAPVPLSTLQHEPLETARGERMTLPPDSLAAASPSPAAEIEPAVRSIESRKYPAWAIAAVLVLAITAVLDVYRAKISHPPARQAVATSPLLHPAAPIVPRDQSSTIIAVGPKATRSAHDLKGMDLETALRALSEKTKRQQQKQQRTTQ